jgi:hypothetical protein
MADFIPQTAAPGAPGLPERFRQFLAEQGFRPWTDDECPATTWFRFEGLKFVARFADGDDDYLQMALGFVLRDESRDELALLRALNREQARTKVVKIYVSPECDLVEFEVELFLDGRMLSPQLLNRSLWTLRGTSRGFFDRIRPEAPKAQA